MKTTTLARRGGFTLVEMLAVITIIVILSALVLGGMKYAKDKQNVSTAKIQVALLSKAIEEYKQDTGAYPPSTNATGENESANLRKLLYLDGRDDKSKKIYLGELDVASKQLWVTEDTEAAKITDPWGNEYRYRTGTSALNPDFDLWSTGKDSKTNEDDPKANDSRDDIRN